MNDIKTKDEETLIPLLVITGPTASGKSSFALKIARKTGGEIVSADSAQVYRYLDIGTAKPTPEEQKAVKHHLIDIIDPHEEFSVADYQKQADKVIAEIYNRGNLPILCGGTGLYINAVTDRYIFSRKGKNEILREKLNMLAEEKGTDHLYEQLQLHDPASAEIIHRRDKKRIIRALEVFHGEGKSISEQQKETQLGKPRYNLLLTGLSMERDELYKKINTRTDLMMEKGFIEEVRSLLIKYPPNSPALQILGYKQIINYLEGNNTYDKLLETIKKETRNYAKRQYTWFRRDNRIKWYDANIINFNAFAENIYDFLKECKAY